MLPQPDREEGVMTFVVYRCTGDPDYFVVTDPEHAGALPFGEMGEARLAFDEHLAKNSIAAQGFYRFEAKSFDPIAPRQSTPPS